jgi:hypothetical protein
MNQPESFFTRKIRISNLDIALVKWSVACIAIAIGCYFADLFRPYILPLVVVGILTGIWATVIWLKAMRETS